MGVSETTTNYALTKFTRGHSVLDTDIGLNMDIIDAALKAIDDVNDASVKVVKDALSAGAADAFAFTWENPESVAIHVLQVVVETTTAGGTGSSVLNVGPATTATGTADTILDGADLNATAIYSSLSAGVSGTNATENVHKLDENGGTTAFLTGKILVANASLLVGKYYIYYVTV